MPVQIKKSLPAKGISKQEENKSAEKPLQTKKRNGSKLKNTKAMKASRASRLKRGEIKSLDDTLAQFHTKKDEELAEMMKAKPEFAEKATHRLDEEQREARLVLMHRMMIRKIPVEEIRKQLGISISMYYKLRDGLQERMRLDVNKVDVPYLIGDTMAFYDEVRSMALTISSSAAVGSHHVKLAAMNVALKAEQDKNNFLTQCGVYSAPVVEHIVRGMVSTGNFTTVDGRAQRVIDAEEVNLELVSRLKSFAQGRGNLSSQPAAPSKELQTSATGE